MRTPLRRAIALTGLTAVVVVSGSIAVADGTAVRDITDQALASAAQPTDLATLTTGTIDGQVRQRLRTAGQLATTSAPDPEARPDEQTAAPRQVAAPDRGDRSAAEPGYVGRASWYGPGFHGNTTANGETYDQWAMTAAHKSLPFGTIVRVTNLANGRSVEVRINDRGPYAAGRDLDLSRAAADALGFSGVASVRIEVL